MPINIKGLIGKALVKDYIRKHGRDTIAAFSCGKDSIANALAIIDDCDIVPVFYYIVPDLPMQLEALDYFERKLFQRKILRYPDQRFYDWVHTGTHMPLSYLKLVDACEPPLINPLHQDGGIVAWRNRRLKWICDQEGIAENTLIAVGVTARDSPQRWMSFQKHGQIRPGSGAWYPIWDYDRAQLLGEIEKSGLKLPIDYHLFGKSLDGLSVEYLVPIKKYRPEDWKVILNWFPLAEVEVWKYEKTYGKF